MTPGKFYLLIGAILVIIVGVILAIFSKPAAAPAGNQQNNFPTSSSTNNSSGYIPGSGSSQNAGSPLLQISGAGTSTLMVNDFLHNGVTEADVVNAGNYYLAGSAGYCTKAGVCPQGASATDFVITYNANAQFFTIALTKEPIGQARLDAETFLEKTLSLNNAQMCALRYYLGTTSYVNGAFAGKNLGFSFCPGATKLPD